MKNRIVLLPIICLIVGSLLSFNSTNPKLEIHKDVSRYILINSLAVDSIHHNAALLIEDQLTVSHNENLFHNNNQYGHGCNYEYSMQFWGNSNQLLKEIPYNRECERFVNHDDTIKSLMQAYIRQLESAPTHFIYNLKVDILKTPKALFKEFEAQGLNIFFLDDATAHLSTLTFSFKQSTVAKDVVSDQQLDAFIEQNKLDAVNSIDLIVDEIAKLTKVESQSEITFPRHSFSGETIVDEAVITLSLANGKNHMEIRELIKANKGEVGELTSPANYYVQLVHESNNLSEIETITSKFEYINKVSEYTSNK